LLEQDLHAKRVGALCDAAPLARCTAARRQSVRSVKASPPHDPVSVLRRKRRHDAGEQASMTAPLRQALLA
jgi:hypothetical protein